jgi:hypothetical protein
MSTEVGQADVLFVRLLCDVMIPADRTFGHEAGIRLSHCPSQREHDL